MRGGEGLYKDFPVGSASFAAVQFGIDLAQLDAALKLTPLQRLILHDQALELIHAVKDAGIRYYGFDPGLVEEVDRI